jgi:homoserine O-acetyltransferase
MNPNWPQAQGTFSLGDFDLAKGGVIRNARIAYKTHGTLNAARDNVVL